MCVLVMVHIEHGDLNGSDVGGAYQSTGGEGKQNIVRATYSETEYQRRVVAQLPVGVFSNNGKFFSGNTCIKKPFEQIKHAYKIAMVRTDCASRIKCFAHRLETLILCKHQRHGPVAHVLRSPAIILEINGNRIMSIGSGKKCQVQILTPRYCADRTQIR